MSTRSRHPRLRTVLVGLVLAGLVPTSLLAAGLIYQVWQLQQKQVQDGLLDAAEAVALAVDRELADDVEQLQMLATQPLGSPVEIAAFRARLGPRPRAGWSDVLLVAPDGRVLQHVPLSSGTRWRGPLDPAFVARVREDGHAISERLARAGETGSETIVVAVPVPGGEAVLAAALDLQAIERLLSERVVRQDGIASVLDRDLRFLARSRDDGGFRGRLVIGPMRGAIPTAPRGKLRSPVYDGPEVYAVWTTIPATGWIVTLGVPAAPIDAALRRSLVEMAGAGIAVVLAAGLLALALARRIGRSIRDVADATQALARGDALPPIRTFVHEHRMVSDALDVTAVQLRAQAARNAASMARETAARRQAEEASRTKDEFLAMLAHELRNPLAAIRAAAAVLEQTPGTSNPAAARASEIVSRQTTHLAHLVDDLLDVARVSRGKIRLEREPVRLDALLRECVEASAGDGERHELALALEPVSVDGDRTRLAQVFGNLLANARKFTPAEGRIDVSLRREDGDAVVTVQDSGEGMPAELVPRVFELFVQGERRLDRPGGGLGIGLSLVRHLVTMHGGTIEAASRGVGLGSTFTVRLPALAAAGAGGDPAPSGSRARQRRADRPVRVLLVEDGEDARVALAALIASWGHTVHEAHDGEDALARLDEAKPEVVLLDLGLPGLDGYEVARRIRAQRGDAVRLVALTGYGAPADRRRAAEAGFDAHLVKPVDSTALARVLEKPDASEAAG